MPSQKIIIIIIKKEKKNVAIFWQSLEYNFLGRRQKGTGIDRAASFGEKYTNLGRILPAWFAHINWKGFYISVTYIFKN